MPGRPDISNCGTATQQIWEFVDFHFQLVVSYHVIKDTTDFLEDMGDLSGIPEDAILCTLDVVELYPDISMKREMALSNFS